MVKISMEPFVKRFQPDRYAAWMLGKDSAVIDHTLATPGTTPELQSWLHRRRKAKSSSKGYCFQVAQHLYSYNYRHTETHHLTGILINRRKLQRSFENVSIRNICWSLHQQKILPFPFQILLSKSYVDSFFHLVEILIRFEIYLVLLNG